MEANPIGCDPCTPRAAPPSRARRRCRRSAPSIGLERSRDRVRSLPRHDRLQGPDRGQRREVEPKLAPTLERVPAVNLATLSAIERRVLWLAVRIVDYANRERPKQDALKVGGHQASSASMVTLMTALYLADLRAEDRVSVKPHASPVLHALEYLLGRLDGRTSHACGTSAGCSRTPRARRIPFRSTTRPARSASARLPRCSGRSPTGS